MSRKQEEGISTIPFGMPPCNG